MQNNNNLFKIISDNVDTIIITLDMHASIKSFNPAAECLFSWDVKNILNKNFIDECNFHKIDCPIKNINTLPDQLAKNTTIEYSTMMPNNIALRWKIFFSPEDKLIVLIGKHDIDFLKHSNKEQKNYLDSIIHNVPHTIFWKDKNLVYLGCNMAFAKSVGLDNPEEIIGKVDYDLPAKKEESDAFMKDDMEVMSNKMPKLNIEELLTLPDGTQATLLTSKIPLFNETNEVVGVLGIFTDITERKNSDAIKAAMEKRLIEAQARLDGMTLVSASLAHELRTPLSSIRNNIRSIEKFLPNFIDGYEKARNAELDVKLIPQIAVKNLKFSAESMNSQIKMSLLFIDMLLMNIREGGFNTGNYASLSLLEMINTSIDNYPMDESERSKIHVNILDDFMFSGNPDLFRHVIYNLLRNALYYVAASNKGEIYITTKLHNDKNILFFKDTGTGVDENILPFIFDRFFSKTYHGAGIGLAFCKMVMESFGGTISCNSTEGDYTEFVLTFPKLTL